MKVYFVTCHTQKDAESPILGIYSTKELAYEHANKIIKRYGYDNSSWNGSGRSLEKNGIYQGYAYISEFEVDKDII